MAGPRKVKHPYITSSPELCGGSPVIADTRFPVRSVVNYVLRQGLSPEELVAEFPHLTLAQVYDAISFYYDHKGQLDAELEECSEVHLQSKRIA
ncbi:MAG: DUF433 domain-containing protein [Candidatus Eremiobacterota bacterium]